MPRTIQGRTVTTESTSIIRWRAAFAKPNRERITLHFVHIVERVSRTAIVARMNIRTWLLTIAMKVSDNFYALCLLPALFLKVDVLDQEEATIHS